MERLVTGCQLALPNSGWDMQGRRGGSAVAVRLDNVFALRQRWDRVRSVHILFIDFRIHRESVVSAVREFRIPAERNTECLISFWIQLRSTRMTRQQEHFQGVLPQYLCIR